MIAKYLLDEYMSVYHLTRIDDTEHLKMWLQKRLCKKMPRPLFVARNKGGGQTYKTLWEVFDILGNANKPCYFYNENKKAIEILVKNGHKSLQNWIDDDSAYLKGL